MLQAVEKIIRWLPGPLLIAAILTFIYTMSSPPEVELPPETSGDELAGWWAWVESKRGDEVVRPQTPDDSLIIVIGAYGSYLERRADSELRTGYGFARGEMSGFADSLFTVLVFDSSTFFPRTDGLYGAAIRRMTGDSLIFSGIGDNATLYKFVRFTRSGLAVPSPASASASASPQEQ
ncbi:MAG TPA: hypothetical protein VF167_15075 [Longimicrobiaceae bacterium]